MSCLSQTYSSTSVSSAKLHLKSQKHLSHPKASEFVKTVTSAHADERPRKQRRLSHAPPSRTAQLAQADLKYVDCPDGGHSLS